MASNSPTHAAGTITGRPGFASSGGLHLAYRLSGEGHLLVCHPGGPGFSAANLERLDGLDQHRTLVLLDPRGTGSSDIPADVRAYALADYVQDVEALRRGLGVETVDFLGHSHGALVGVAYAAAHPDRVDRLVLLGAGARWHAEQLAASERAIQSRSDEPWFADAMAAWRAEPDSGRSERDRAALLRRFLPLYFGRVGQAERGWIERHSSVPPHAPAVNLLYTEIISTLDLRPLLFKIAARTLVLAGSKDFITPPESAAEVAGGITEGTLRVLDGAGHFLWVEAPGRFVREVNATMSPSDAELVRAAQAGDPAGLAVLFVRYRAALHAQALALLGRGGEGAADAVQDTFLTAVRRLGELRDPASVGAWLRAVLRNTCLMQLRTARWEVASEPPRLELPAELGSPDERIERLAQRDWVWTALARLSEPLRLTAMLRFLGDHHSYDQIAAICDVPVGTVRSRVNQARKKLAEALLDTAEQPHTEGRELTISRVRHVAAMMDELKRRHSYDLWVASCTPALVLSDATGAELSGRQWLVRALENDLRAGVELHVTNVMASRGITIIEGNFASPPGASNPCPASTTQVHFDHGGMTHRIVSYYAPARRPR